ncbi:hypothetical protein B9Z55_016811 [Caenorhabditis nigoni]|uniref:Uncharacterized protein n=1 Tax=Caenorhabditis nigoni TaxID=1611254 RepID=A0A2G5T6S1_9PELO|nr:hypothetical protein B9Z55_016811 [Caenorhabditis nigoni]
MAQELAELRRQIEELQIMERLQCNNVDGSANLELARSRELEIKNQELEILAKEIDAELSKDREKRQEELEVLTARLKAEYKDTVERFALQRDPQLESEKNNLEKKKEERDKLLTELLEQQEKFYEMLKTQESLRQKDLSQLRVDRSKQRKNVEAQILELKERLFETKKTGGDRKQEVFEQNVEDQKEWLHRKGKTMWNELLNTKELMASFGADVKFESFQQGCTLLRDQYRAFYNEYDDIEPQLIHANNCMKRVTPIEPLDLEKCISALRKFRNQTVEISVYGSEDESYYRGLISEVEELVREFVEDINLIIATTEGYDHEECSDNVNIDENLTRISENREKLSVLMQKFNVIGRAHLQATLAIQMEKGMTARQEAAEKEKKDHSTPKQDSE